MRIGLVGRRIAAGMLMGGMLSTASAMAAVNAYMEIKPVQMKGDPSRGSSSERIRVTSVARDAASGMASGKRMHKPFTITKEIDASSPMLKQAMTKGTSLGAVAIVFEGAGEGGAKTAQRVELTNAVVSSIKVVGTSEQITLDYESIVVTYTNGNKSAADDWESPK